MKLSFVWVVLAASLSFAGPEIVDFQNGSMTWTNDATNAASVFTVEWASDLTSGVWRTARQDLTDIHNTDRVTTAAVRDAFDTDPEKIYRSLNPIVDFNQRIVWRANDIEIRQIKAVSAPSIRVTVGTKSC